MEVCDRLDGDDGGLRELQSRTQRWKGGLHSPLVPPSPSLASAAVSFALFAILLPSLSAAMKVVVKRESDPKSEGEEAEGEGSTPEPSTEPAAGTDIRTYEIAPKRNRQS